MTCFILADNQELTRKGLSAMLSAFPDCIQHRVNTSAELTGLLVLYPKAVVLLDFKLLDFDSEDSLIGLTLRFPDASWLLLSDRLSVSFLRRIAYETCCVGVVFKDSSEQAVMAGIEYALKHERYMCHRATEMLLSLQKHDMEHGVTEDLTYTEIEILRCIAQGKTTRQIAQERFLSRHTVNTHRKNIFRKLGVKTAHDAVMAALRMGVFDLSVFG